MLDIISKDLVPILSIAVSPIWLIAVTVLVVSGAKRSAFGFLVGWFIGVVVMTGAAAWLASGPAGEASDDEGFNYLSLIVGILFLYLSYKSFEKRPKPGEQAEEPKWITSLATMPLWKVIALGALALETAAKNIPLYILIGSDIAAADLPTGEAIATLVVVGLLATSVPTMIALLPYVGGDRGQEMLESLRTWLVDHNAVITGVILAFVGFGQIGNALGSI